VVDVGLDGFGGGLDGFGGGLDGLDGLHCLFGCAGSVSL
jgi:hypothetical protein